MPLYIRDDEVNELAEKFRVLVGARSKTEAVRRALQEQIASLTAKETLTERIRRIQSRAAAQGLRPDGSDDKSLMDDLSGEL